MNACHACAGTGVQPGQMTIDCAACEGSGRILGVSCDVCGGDGVQTIMTDVRCVTCCGSGEHSLLTLGDNAIVDTADTQLWCVLPATEG